MKKHEIIKMAYDKYPKDTKFHWPNDSLPKIVESCGEYIFMNDIDGKLMLADAIDKDVAVWNGKEWAEIVKQKIAVKVKNEKEFKALMKYYDSKGWHFYNGKSPLELEMVKPIIEFVQGFYFVGNSSEYQIIHFSDFAKEHNIKLPLLTSEDGVDLYEGEEYFRVGRSGASADGDWKLFIPDALTSCHFVCCYKETDKAFSTKESALKWIEEQKPKSKEVKMNNDAIATVYKDGWLKFNVPIFRMSENHLKDLITAFKELS